MLSSKQVYLVLGKPEAKAKYLTMWDVSEEYTEINDKLPRRIYCNKLLVHPLNKAFKNLKERGCMSELKTWDGCFNIRPIRGCEDKYNELIKLGDYFEASRYLSLHSWALAIDVNAFENKLGQKPKLSSNFVKCFTDAGFDWGGRFKRVDGMHFQLAQL